MDNWALFPSGQLCLGFGQSSHLQVFPPVPVSSWLFQQEVQRYHLRNSPSCAGGVPRCRLCLEAEDVFLLFCLLNLLKLTDPLLNVNQNKLKSWVCERDSVVFWRALLKGSLPYCWAGEAQKRPGNAVAPSAAAAHSQLEQRSTAASQRLSLNLAQLSWLYCLLGFWSVDLPH